MAFHSYSRYKESSQFETYSYNVVLGMNSARAEARALSRKVRLCAGFLTMVEDLRNPKNAQWTQCNVPGSSWKYGWYIVARNPDSGYVPEVVEMKAMAGKYPMKASGGVNGFMFSSNGSIGNIDSSAEGSSNLGAPVLIGAVSVKNSLCKFVYAQTVGDIVRGECAPGECGSVSVSVNGTSEQVDATEVCSGN
ncbi:MAG: hypothetical protein SOW06_01995 [Succinivibrionaceae bacterium]|nr:hypothetical protein [Pseudomonadota bacterium]MDY3144113.1 hypothetical protein [Succinivibrionaceae bacterium]